MSSAGRSTTSGDRRARTPSASPIGWPVCIADRRGQRACRPGRGREDANGCADDRQGQQPERQRELGCRSEVAASSASRWSRRLGSQRCEVPNGPGDDVVDAGGADALDPRVVRARRTLPSRGAAARARRPCSGGLRGRGGVSCRAGWRGPWQTMCVRVVVSTRRPPSGVLTTGRSFARSVTRGEHRHDRHLDGVDAERPPPRPACPAARWRRSRRAPRLDRDVVPGPLGHVPAVLEHLVEHLGGLELAAQVARDRPGRPARRRRSASRARRSPRRRSGGRCAAPVGVEVVEQPAGLVLLDVEAGEPQQPARVVAGVDDLGLDLDRSCRPMSVVMASSSTSKPRSLSRWMRSSIRQRSPRLEALAARSARSTATR